MILQCDKIPIDLNRLIYIMKDGLCIMKKIFIAVLAAISLFVSAASAYAYTPDSAIDTEAMLDTIRAFSARPRGIKDAEITVARQRVIDIFNAYGLKVSTQTFQTDLTDGSGNPYTAVNIIGSIMPNTKNKTNDILIIGAHYDGASGFPAANDNGSGLAVMFELVRLLHDVPTDTEIRFVSFDAEEPGLVGSEYYAANLGDDRERVIGMLNFDMLAGKRDGEVRIDTIDGNSNYLLELLKESENYSHLQPHRQEVGISDHQSFSAREIPILYFEHPAITDEIHKAADTIDTISTDMLVYAADAGLTVAKKIMSEDTPSFIKTAHPDTDDTVYTISKKLRLPFGTSASDFEKETGIHLTQIPSSDSGSVYTASVRLLNMEDTFTLTAYDKGTSNSISDIYICLSDGDEEKIKSVMTAAWGEPQLQGTLSIWHNIYGNTYVLNPEKLYFYPYSQNDEENYYITDGALSHIAGMPVTDSASRVWARVKPLMTDEELESVSSLKVTTDGIGGDMTVQLSQASDGTCLVIDYADLLKADGACITDTALQKALSIAWATYDGNDGAADSWARSYVSDAIKNDILPEDMAYGFTENITRLDFCTIAYNILKDKIPTATETVFKDTASQAVNALALAGIISGRDDEHFAPDDEITREEAAVVLSNIADYLSMPTASDKIFIYADDKSISSWAADNVYKLRNLGIMSGMGDNEFLPQSKYTKQHAVSTIMRIYDKTR
jgi:hypothetical protein